MDFLKMLVNDFHSTIVATIGSDGHPQTRTIDMMLYDDDGIYFLTAKGKSFYNQLMEQNYIALSATKDKKSISIRGKVRCIGENRLLEIFEKNPYMQEIYPIGTRSALIVFQIYEACGEYFDISVPSHIVRENISIGTSENRLSGYIINDNCTNCGLCMTVCPQKCIDTCTASGVIKQENCLHCGQCAEICPYGVINRISG